MLLNTSTPLHIGGQYSTFYLTQIYLTTNQPFDYDVLHDKKQIKELQEVFASCYIKVKLSRIFCTFTFGTIGIF